MPVREVPYGAFNFLVDLGSGDARSPLGGFSDVSGINTEQTVAEYRIGNSLVNHTQKIPGMHKSGDITLKRGVVGAADLWDWINQSRTEGFRAKRNVMITLLDETHAPAARWRARGVLPLKYTGPTLAGKGGGDVAVEELVLSIEELDFEVA